MRPRKPTGKQNVTIALDKQTIQKAKVAAARRSTSISALLARQIEALVAEDEAYERAQQQALALLDRGFHLGGVHRVSRTIGWLLVASPAERSSAETSQIDHHRHDQDQQIHARCRLPRIHHPRVRKRRQRQEDESKQRQKQCVVCPLQIVREEVEQQQHNARKRQKQNQQKTAHQTPSGTRTHRC